MTYAIYYLSNPIDNSIVYVGKTSDLDLKHYLKSKYWKLNEVIRGERNYTPLFKLMEELLPTKLEIKLIRWVNEDKPFQNADFVEKYYIEKYKKDYDLLNITDGGDGGNTYKYKSEEELLSIGEKISKKLKGRKKPKGFAEHLRAIRIGKNNPMARKLSKPIGAYKSNKLIATFDYAYQVDEFIGKRCAYSNVKKVLTGKIIYSPYGYNWKYIE